MKIEYLQEKDAERASRFFKDNVDKIEYYNKSAREAFEKDYNSLQLKKKIKSKKHLLLVAKEKDDIIGISFGWLDYDVAFRDWTLIKKDFRRKGIGSKLIENFEKSCKKIKVHKVQCDCRKNNKIAARFLRKNKYRPEAFLKRHWFNQDFIIWYKFI